MYTLSTQHSMAGGTGTIVIPGRAAVWNERHTLDAVLACNRETVVEQLKRSCSEYLGWTGRLTFNPEKVAGARLRPSNVPFDLVDALITAHRIRIEAIRKVFPDAKIGSFAPIFWHWIPRPETFLRHHRAWRFIYGRGLAGCDYIEMQCSSQLYGFDPMWRVEMPAALRIIMRMGEAAAELAASVGTPVAVVPSVSDRVYGPKSGSKYGTPQCVDGLIHQGHVLQSLGYRSASYWIGNATRRDLDPVLDRFAKVNLKLQQSQAA